MKQRIAIKPLSVNEAWKGTRFKTNEYRYYERECAFNLKPIQLPNAPYEIILTFGMSSKLSDWDNPVKPFQDILQKKYGFNDRDIMKATVHKIHVPKGCEYAEFELLNYDNAKV